ncbi:Alpha-(1,3)-fucosyltransferase 11 [Halotydeus destructor]|nr:Alpha-(1,3)-fucosyltransferase 11 [Halotydeus destructor]
MKFTPLFMFNQVEQTVAILVTFFLLTLDAVISVDDFGPVIEWYTPRLFPHSLDTTRLVCGDKQGKQYQCLATRESRPDVDALIFYGPDLDRDLELLPWRHREPIWALINEESPLNSYILVQAEILSLFQVTATFSRNSSYPLTTQHIKSQEFLYSEEHYVDIKKKNKYRKEGLAPILYLQSNCNVPSDRDRYVQKLMQYIQIDSFGNCLRNKYFPKNSRLRSPDTFDSTELYNFMARYKFVLAFENAFCDDYVTEKLFRALHVGVVPIYRGASNVRDWLPDKMSIVQVSEHYEKSPKLLANFISQLDGDDDRYQSYLAWKGKPLEKTNEKLKSMLDLRDWSPESHGQDFFRGFECHVCRHLHGSIRRDTTEHRINGCPQPVPALFLNVSSLDKDDKWNLWSFEWDNARRFAIEDPSRRRSIIDKMGLTRQDKDSLLAQKHDEL